MSDPISTGAMLFGPEHALQVAAEAIGTDARSTEMAVGIVFGIKACIEEYSRMLRTPPDFPPEPVKPADKSKELARK